MKRVRRGIPLIAYLSLENAFLYLLIGLLIGGYATSGKVEAGRYFLQHKGYYTEVYPLIFTYSRFHEMSVVALGTVAVPATIVARIRGRRRDIQRFGGVFDAAEGLAWKCFDSWRQPSIELFVRASPQECLRRLDDAIDRVSPFDESDRPWDAYFGKRYFRLFEWASATDLIGRLSLTSQGTYVRVWRRSSALGVLFLTVLAGVVLGTLASALVWLYVRTLPTPVDQYSVLGVVMRIIVPACVTVALFASVWFTSRFNPREIAAQREFLKEALHREGSGEQDAAEKNRDAGLIERLPRPQSARATSNKT